MKKKYLCTCFYCLSFFVIIFLTNKYAYLLHAPIIYTNIKNLLFYDFAKNVNSSLRSVKLVEFDSKLVTPGFVMQKNIKIEKLVSFS